MTQPSMSGSYRVR